MQPQMYITGSVVVYTRYSRLGFLQRIKSVKFGLDFFFEPLSFGDEATHRYQSFLLGVTMMELCCPQIWYSLVHAPLKSRVEKSPPPLKWLNHQLENVAIANALQLEAARRRAVPTRFNFVARAKFKVAQPIPCRLRAFLLLIRYVTL